MVEWGFDLKLHLEKAKELCEASYDSSEELRFMALRSAVEWMIEVLEKLVESEAGGR